MMRNLKILGIALIVAFGLSAAAASMASATFSFTAPEGPIAITGSQVGEVQNIFTTADGSQLKCEIVEFSATQAAASATDLTVVPQYSKCKWNGLVTEVFFNGCNYTFTTPTNFVQSGVYTGEPPHIICPAGNVIVSTVTMAGVSFCTKKIEAQTPTSGHVIYRNEGAGTTRGVTIEFTVTGIHYKVDKALCGGGPVDSTIVNGAYSGGITVRGYRDEFAHNEANHKAFVMD